MVPNDAQPSSLAALSRPAGTPARSASCFVAMSGDAAEAAIEMAKWTKYSYGAIAFCGALSTYIGIVEYRHMMHPHAHEDVAYSHMKIRAKPYPWDCPDCNLFEAQCFRDCKAAAKE